MNHHQQLISDEILSVQAQKDHCVGAMERGNLESWELKEYGALITQYEQKLIELNARMPLAC
jgi:hypothetical protein